MTVRLTWHQQYPGGRIVARLGAVSAGAIFPPPAVTSQNRTPWEWQFWIADVTTPQRTGAAKSELAAKNALTARVSDWLREAGLRQDGA